MGHAYSKKKKKKIVVTECPAFLFAKLGTLSPLSQIPLKISENKIKKYKCTIAKRVSVGWEVVGGIRRGKKLNKTLLEKKADGITLAKQIVESFSLECLRRSCKEGGSQPAWLCPGKVWTKE